MNTITATNETIKQIVMDEMKKIGTKADLNHIDVSQVTDMSGLFEQDDDSWGRRLRHCNFNGDISKWDVSNVKHMNGMFRQSKFNGDITDWNVSDNCCKDNMFAQQNIKLAKKHVSRMHLAALLGGSNSEYYMYSSNAQPAAFIHDHVAQYLELLEETSLEKDLQVEMLFALLHPKKKVNIVEVQPLAFDFDCASF